MAKHERKLPSDEEISCSSLFLDSGAFTMRQQSWKFAKETGKRWQAFYDTAEFWQYMDDYVEFVKKHGRGFDLYANVDVIPDPDLTWRNQQYLEEKGLRPIPVVHLGTSIKWVRHYVDLGYDLLGLGGLVASGGFGSQRGVRRWLDQVFDEICNTPDHLPKIRTHGFGLMGPLTFRYPFYSVDSTAWVMRGSFGGVLTPKKRKGKFTFGEDDPDDYRAFPYTVAVTDQRSVDEKVHIPIGDDHFQRLGIREQANFLEWLEFIGIPFGEMDDQGKVIQPGVSNNRRLRILAGLRFYQHLQERYRPYPWPFYRRGPAPLGLV